MINFYDGELTDILPSSLKDDPVVQALSLALREQTRQMHKYQERVKAYCSIDTAPEEMLDLMAKELRTQYYRDDLDIETKRGLVRNTIVWYMKAGTAEAVEELVQILFGEGEVKEWFEYGGEPYMFKIKTNSMLTPDINARFMEMIQKVKNARSHLEGIEIHRTLEQKTYTGTEQMSICRTVPILDGGYNEIRAHPENIRAAVGSLFRTKQTIREY